MSKRRGGTYPSVPSGTLPPARDTAMVDLEDLDGREAAWTDRLPAAGSRLPVVRRVGQRFPAKQVLIPPRAKRAKSRTGLAFHAPANVKACVIRKQRREVLFAVRKAGFSGSARKRHWRRTVNSQYRC